MRRRGSCSATAGGRRAAARCCRAGAGAAIVLAACAAAWRGRGRSRRGCMGAAGPLISQAREPRHRTRLRAWPMAPGAGAERRHRRQPAGCPSGHRRVRRGRMRSCNAAGRSTWPVATGSTRAAARRSWWMTAWPPAPPPGPRCVPCASRGRRRSSSPFPSRRPGASPRWKANATASSAPRSTTSLPASAAATDFHTRMRRCSPCCAAPPKGFD